MSEKSTTNFFLLTELLNSLETIKMNPNNKKKFGFLGGRGRWFYNKRGRKPRSGVKKAAESSSGYGKVNEIIKESTNSSENLFVSLENCPYRGWQLYFGGIGLYMNF